MTEPTTTGAVSTASLVLGKAHARVARGSDQYDPEDKERNFELIANYWTEYLRGVYPGTRVEILPVDVGMMMALLKIARVTANPEHMDSYVDIAGYAALAAEEIDGNRLDF